MRVEPTRRQFVRISTATTLGMAASWCIDAEGQVQQSQNEVAKASDTFPSQDPATVREIVLRSHFDFNRVRELVERQPALAKASWDWGFGDWESALGAASHTGQRKIAEFLLANGARPTIFSAAMLGQLAVVRAFVEAHPGIQKTHGPHGITLLAHARAGGERAQAVVAYLNSVGDADVGQTDLPLSDEKRTLLLGEYITSSEPAVSIRIVEMRNGAIGLQREGRDARPLMHLGAFKFNPAGAPAVEISFRIEDARAIALTVRDSDLMVTAHRKGQSR